MPSKHHHYTHSKGMSAEDANSQIQQEKQAELQRLAKALKFPTSKVTTIGDSLNWELRGGFAGQKVIDRVVAAAKQLGWQSSNKSGGSPDGSVTRDDGTLYSPSGDRLRTTTRYGSTKNDNYYSLSLVISPSFEEFKETKKISLDRLRSLIREVLGQQQDFAKSVPGIADSINDIAMTAASEIEDVYNNELEQEAVTAIEIDIRLALTSAVNSIVQEVYNNIDSGKYNG